MCIRMSTKRFRTRACGSVNNTLINNISNEWNGSKNSCISYHHDDIFPWYTPELDIYNQNHMLYYNSSDAGEVIDYTAHPFPNSLWIVAPVSEIVIKSSVFVPIVVWGIFGNLALLYIIMKFRHLRTPTNMIIANMATVDLITLVIYPWIFLICNFFQNYPLGEFGCRIDGWLEFSLLLVNVMNLSTISYDRLTAIVLPQETRLSRRSAKTVIAVTWIISFILASPLIIFREYRKRQWKDFLEVYCTEDAKIIAIYWHILLVMAVWLPLLIMLICYIAIFIKLDRYEQKVLKREHPLSVSYKTKVAKVLFIVVITFVVCRMPFTALIFKRNQWLKQNEKDQVIGADQILWFVARYLIYTNAALDPLLYGLTNENFRRAFRTTALTKIFFPKKKKLLVPERICVNVIQPRGPYKTEHKSDAWLIAKSKNSFESSKDSSQTDTKNVMIS